MSDENLPAELFPQYCTLEYQVVSPVVPSPPAYIFVVDTCLSEDELGACRAALSQAIQMIPEYAQVGSPLRKQSWLVEAGGMCLVAFSHNSSDESGVCVGAKPPQSTADTGGCAGA